MYKILILLVLPLLLFSRFQITTHMPFEALLIKKIAENNVRIRVLSKDYSPKTKELKYSEISKFANTSAYFHFSMDVEKKYEEMLKKVNPKLKTVDMSKGITKIEKGNISNPYVWTDPILLREIAKNIYTEIIAMDPKNKDQYRRNYEIFLNELDELFLKIREKLYSSEIYNIYVFDKHWAYFANRFGLNLYTRKKAIVKADEINPLVSFVDKNDIRAILVAKDSSYNYAVSIAGYTKIAIKSNDVYNEFVLSNLWDLSKELAE